MTRMIKGLFMFCALGLALCVAGGCGYTTRSMISDEYRTISVAQFLNKIDITRDSDAAAKYKLYKPMLETDITRAVIDKYLFDGNLKPVKKENADLLLKGELVEFRREPLQYDASENVIEYRISIVVNITLYDNKTDKVIWQENNFTGEQAYYISGSLAKTDGTAVNEAIADLARRIVERTVEQW